MGSYVNLQPVLSRVELSAVGAHVGLGLGDSPHDHRLDDVFCFPNFIAFQLTAESGGFQVEGAVSRARAQFVVGPDVRFPR